ncbi:CidA/LrgA family protein [Nocardioides marmotae]|uniref:CidA/LrgA family protein n=1 Tax=Nocardioides marmotae TaxID=2663857 RepID=A0A6I3IYP4_9ACTN|nr:CidA/LrgA family protein [Nocardioides marmotae]MCR6030160.1 CidA/LrgA family protein [Gordonia jinghuaiqii]MBC9733040.1 CidA/LrgA family protein [Nocardioides marmotae]MTB84154.1 CidA/LrgA family protein [Nocardioides marmotae]MTB93791.1 CidA/LrgA family protein [Nocardioides marmotae]QKE00125.1 CidA/LrgA family protein [Nocardioides marmotae]
MPTGLVVGLTWLVACQLAGEVLVRLSGVPVPGPVAGMVVLLLALEVRRRRGRDTEQDAAVRAADGLLRHLQLLFVPAGVGVIAYLGTLREAAVPVLVAMVGSWALGLLVIGWTTRVLERPGRQA